jgi:hypothetical protein
MPKERRRTPAVMWMNVVPVHPHRGGVSVAGVNTAATTGGGVRRVGVGMLVRGN